MKERKRYKNIFILYNKRNYSMRNHCHIRSKFFVLLIILILSFQFVSVPALAALQQEQVTDNQSPISLAALGVTDTTAEIFWVSKDKENKAKEYDIYRNNEKITTTDSFAYTDVNLTPKTKYIYQIKAKDINGNVIAESNSLEISTSESTSTLQLTLSASDVTDSLVKLNWVFSTTQQEIAIDKAQSSQELIEYKVFKNEECINTTVDTGIVVTDLSPETEYTFRVTATFGSNKNSCISNTLNIKTLSLQAFTKGKAEPEYKAGLGYKADRFIIKFKNEKGKEKMKGVFKNRTVQGKAFHGKENKGFLTLSHVGKVKLEDFVKELKDKKLDSDIEYIQPDYEFELTSDDPYYTSQWGLENKQADTAEANTIPIEQRIEMLPPHLIDIIESNQEFKEFLLNSSMEELQEKMMSGNIPGDIPPEELMEIMHDPMFMEMFNREENRNQLAYLCDAGVTGAWEKATGVGATVGVIDTGVDITHEDMIDNIWVNTGEIPNNNIDDDGNGYIDDVNGWNFAEDNNQVFNNNNISDENHGTHIAGTIAAKKDNGKGIVGVAPSAKILPLKVFQGGKAYTSDIIDAIKYAESCGVKIVNCSWGSANGNPALLEAIQNSGMLFVCATGNSGVNIDTSPIYPAAFDCPNIITTASVNQYGCLSGFSNYGETSVDVAAPGESIESTMPGNTYGQLSGTSMAAAFVSGEAALLLSESGSVSITDIKERIMSDGEKLSSLTGKVGGSTKINCFSAMSNISSGQMIQVPYNGQMQGGNADGEDPDSYNMFTITTFQGQLTKIACGDHHSISLRADGTVWTCGYNASGQLGDGTTVNKYTPVQVNSISGVTAIAGGGIHSLALKNDGTVWTWGNNASGQLGDGTTVDKTTPVQVRGISGVTAISGGDYYSLALKNDGTVWTWGSNSSGQLGDGTTVDKTTPVQVSGLSGVTAIAGGISHNMALKNDGTVWTWGSNSSGQLGDGTTVGKTTPVKVSGLSGVTAISAGCSYSMALKNDGTVWMWGNNYFGQLGDGTTITRTVPVKVSGLSDVAAIYAGFSHSMALKIDGSVWTCGDNSYGKLGDGTEVTKHTPVRASNLSNIMAIAGGFEFSLALKNDGTVWAWGDNYDGQSGDGARLTRPDPIKVSGLSGITEIAGGYNYSIALKNDGTVWTWGDNSYGQLGDGTKDTKNTPVQVCNLIGIKAVAGCGYHSIALKNDGTVWAWGNNSFGQLGDRTNKDKTTPVQVSGLSGVMAITGGQSHNMAIRNDGTVWAWGSNCYGQLGDGTKTDKTTPIQVSGLNGVTKIAGGSSHSIALKSDGTVWAWGQNKYGQLGDGTTVNRTAPTKVSSLNGITAIYAGYRNNLALKNDGTVWAWGLNSSGQLGDGTTINRTVPIKVAGLSGITEIAGGSFHSLALKNDGTAWVWGDSYYGQLGNETTIRRTTPAQVNGISGITSITGGYYHTIARMNDGTLCAWGDNSCGELGNGEARYYSIPRWTFGTPIGSSLTHNLACTLNKKFDFVIKANNIQSLAGRTFTVIYNTSELDIVDLCSMTHKKEVDAGTIQGTDITITQVAPGVIKFTINKPITTGKTWSGIVNEVTFIPTTSGMTTVQCIVQ